MLEEKPLRADARRNRAKVLAAAEAVFTAKGMSAPTEEVAKAAGVGVGTLFRHFPTKEALLEAVLQEHLRRFAAEAVRWAGVDDPGNAFFAFLKQWVEMAATKNAYTDALAAAGTRAPEAAGVRDEVVGALRTLLTRAQDAGTVRSDVGVTELIALMVGTSRGAEHLGGDPALRQRMLEIVFDGLRPSPR
ncbi:helix-turn-helix domain containing protein [Amycolatopsis cynarae]|uniref:Helix-turn-helix domain containing protein n=1 Tax=Amycolatopsis cynarae TaxID=2995223 RepID=A0ABY7BAY0_9PSEU|nr:TetR/AcrR family transcriptional regulator [Amycolatopsis sp. HUAS 11-8]WAL69147.1 helix-turn-helix domain containing protein [Amycolatopsis sp. HUAS 11-8]